MSEADHMTAVGAAERERIVARLSEMGRTRVEAFRSSCGLPQHWEPVIADWLADLGASPREDNPS